MHRFYIWLEFEKGARVRFEVHISKKEYPCTPAAEAAEGVGERMAEKFGARFCYAEDIL
jgi:hypothetical protein